MDHSSAASLGSAVSTNSSEQKSLEAPKAAQWTNKLATGFAADGASEAFVEQYGQQQTYSPDPATHDLLLGLGDGSADDDHPACRSSAIDDLSKDDGIVDIEKAAGLQREGTEGTQQPQLIGRPADMILADMDKEMAALQQVANVQQERIADINAAEDTDPPSPTMGRIRVNETCNAITTALEGVKSEWDAVLDVLQGFDPTSGVLEELVRRAATKIGFWQPDDWFLVTARKEFQARLVEHAAKYGKKDSGFCEDGLISRKGIRRRTYSEGLKTTPDGCVTTPDPADDIRCSSTSKTSEGTIDSNVLRMHPRRGSVTDSMALLKSSSINMVAYDLPPVPDHIVDSAKDQAKAEKLLVANSAASRVRQFKWALFAFVTAQMYPFGYYAVFYITPKAWDGIGLPIVIARASAYGACMWTGILFLTMSRDLIMFITRFSCIRNSQIAMQLINCHKEIHIFSAIALIFDSCLHALMHHVGTFVALERNDAKALNKVLVCATDKMSMPDGYIGKFTGNILKVFQYPVCPLPEDAAVNYLTGVFSTPGITGYYLLFVIFALAWFSRQKKRTSNFRLFYYLHHMLVPAWIILMVLHGANDWGGLGFPLTLLVCSIPIFLYSWTRIRRAYLTYRSHARVVNAEKSATGKLLRLEVELVPLYRKCKVGEYAYINVAGAGRMEWHPFTICMAKEAPEGRQRITFCIMNAGKWTKTIHELIGSHINTDQHYPKVYIDGPFYAPTVSMPSRSTVVGIGAGVGVTPFLSFLGSVCEDASSEHKSAHVFWSSRFATDFMLFKDLLSSLDQRAKASPESCTTTFHLHATGGGWDGKGIGVMFDLPARKIWGDWLQRLDAKSPEEEPTFAKYNCPLHAVVSRNILESKRPLPVAVGSPDWMTELLAIGEADLAEDVFVYYCGNDMLKSIIQGACIACNELRRDQGQKQRYYFYFERFG